jgi:hypothetical protein
MDQLSNLIISAGVVWAGAVLAVIGAHWRARQWECRMLERWARSDLEYRLAAVERQLDRIKLERIERGHS